MAHPKTVSAQEMDLSELWSLYKESGDPEAKSELLLKYLYLVKQLVRRMMPKYNCYNEYDDLVNTGIIGLIDAVEKFDLKHGVKFETYAVTRIRGEILDYMRSQDWAPSSLRKKITQINDAYEMLERQYGSQPSDDMVAKQVDMPVDQVKKIVSQAHSFNVINFEESLSDGFQLADIPGNEDDIPENAVMNEDLKRILAEMIDQLPEKERLVITLYYYEELMLKDIADIMGVSESRVSQIHSKVLSKLRSKLQSII